MMPVVSGFQFLMTSPIAFWYLSGSFACTGKNISILLNVLKCVFPLTVYYMYMVKKSLKDAPG